MSQTFDEIFDGQRVMAILRGMPPQETVELASRAWDLGIDLVEVPVQTPEALSSLRAAIDAGAQRGRAVGAGTVITVEQVAAVAQAGAAFTVAPGFDPAVLAASAAAGLPHLPGVATPSEIQQALRHGARWVKAFPATALGTAWFSAMRGPFPQVRFVATGGLDARSAPAYLDAGARVAAVGSALSDPAQVELLADLVGSRD
ncbi:bifunctional 4-hydroxy-2-oxoglutarate aldolase/2-dehydro-3-deoxy-phosphogluconate aldolase [Marinactinospora thermotolerans]|uniref:2-keto-3-deoxy-phosphogluconate aldolase n=1 Tax=Marinactinospora thermotolerans DSM 45154 TaxID=1122192 RepID=A0A1T4N7E9_9ACTN|nr:bifunctional 4-hydroxy-2-oxoglutarate aldolase/2-dehydro-3-deoxy-phosphogluconate aldolase [Marinactinospora thermotolerans]SJZ75132.1 2-keto-3-deoxy-phosphogluconate aldolase [Marinactinospora thermotolerans DSM 45154]